MGTGIAKQLGPQEALAERGTSRSTAFVCPYPHCGVFAQHHWGAVNAVQFWTSPSSTSSRRSGANPKVILAECEACGNEVIFVNDRLLFPPQSAAPPPSADMPAEAKADFDEARAIYGASPRGAAALLRLALEKMLPALGATKKGINDAIGELVKTGVIPSPVQRALDTVRVVGNEAVHPGELDLRDDEATVLALFNLLNFIVEKAITEPKEIALIYASLPLSKLQGIADRDGVSTDGSSSITKGNA